MKYISNFREVFFSIIQMNIDESDYTSENLSDHLNMTFLFGKS